MTEAPYSLLVISSAYDMAGTASIERLSRQMEFLTTCGVFTELLIDPTQAALERTLENRAWDCVYSTTMHSFRAADDHQEARPFNIFQVIEQRGAQFVGSDAFTQLLINDKTLCSNRSGIGIAGFALARDRAGELATLCGRTFGDECFPLMVKPNSLSCSLGIGEESVVETFSALQAQVSALFQRFPALFEVRIERYLAGAREFTVSVLGNGDAVCHSVAELRRASGQRVYGEADKATEMGERRLRYWDCEETDVGEALRFHARRLFAWFGMRDMARFDILWDGRAHLIEVNAIPVLGNSFSWEWQRSYGLSEDGLMALMLLEFHYRQLRSGRPSPLPPGVEAAVPEPLRAVLREAPPVAVPPESTVPNNHCPYTWYYTMVDRTAAETDVLAFLRALVHLLKPAIVVETGTYLGSTAAAMGIGLQDNGRGRLYTLEIDETLTRQTQEKLDSLPVTVICQASLTYIPPGPIDLLFLDSHRPIRGAEFRHFHKWLHPRSVVVWHDSAPEHQAVYEAVNELYWGAFIDRLLLPTPRGLTVAMLRRDDASSSHSNAA